MMSVIHSQIDQGSCLINIGIVDFLLIDSLNMASKIQILEFLYPEFVELLVLSDCNANETFGTCQSH